jgi:Protein of unknown function (DUF3489)
VFAYWRVLGPGALSLAFQANRSDELSRANEAQKEIRTNMTSIETTTATESALVEEQAQHDGTVKASSKKDASPKNGTPKVQKTAKRGKSKAASAKKEAGVGKSAAKPAPAKEATAPRPESKGAKILGLISRAKGATLAEIMKATDWQAHSVRGFISTAGKKHGLKIESAKNDAGDRVYKIAK